MCDDLERWGCARRMATKSRAVAILAVLVLLLGSAVPSYAARGGVRGGGGHFGG